MQTCRSRFCLVLTLAFLFAVQGGNGGQGKDGGKWKKKPGFPGRKPWPPFIPGMQGNGRPGNRSNARAAKLAVENFMKKAAAAKAANVSEILQEMVPLLLMLNPSAVRAFPKFINESQLVEIMKFCSDCYELLSPPVRHAIVGWIAKMYQGKNPGDEHRTWLQRDKMVLLGLFLADAPIPLLKKTSAEQYALYFNSTEQCFVYMTNTRKPAASVFLDKLFSTWTQDVDDGAERLGQLVCHFQDQETEWMINNNKSEDLLQLLENCTRRPSKVFRMIAKKLLANESFDGRKVRQLGRAITIMSPFKLLRMTFETVNTSLEELSTIKDWSRSQCVMLLIIMRREKDIQASDLSRLGYLVPGISSNGFQRMSAQGLMDEMPTVLANQGEMLSQTQKKAVFYKILKDKDLAEVLSRFKVDIAPEIPLYMLMNLTEVTKEIFKEQVWDSGQATYLLQRYFGGRKILLTDLKDLGQNVRCLSCQMIKSLDNETLLEASTFLANLFPPMTQSQFRCLAERIWLNFSLSSISDTDFLRIHPNILLFIPMADLKKIPYSRCPLMTYLIGKAELPFLPVGSLQRQSFITFAKSCWNNTVEDTENLGRLVCELAAPDVEKLSSEAFEVALEQFRFCLQLNDTQQKAVASKALMEFGSPSTWNPEILQKLGVVLAMLDEESLSKIPNEEETMFMLSGLLRRLRGVLKYTARNPPPYRPLLKTTTLEKKLSTVIKEHRKNSRMRRSANPVCPTASQLLELEENGFLWPLESLICINETFEELVGAIGQVEGFSMQQLDFLKGIALEVWGTVENLTSEFIPQLGYIMLSLSPEELRKLNLTVDTLEALTNLPLAQQNMTDVVAWSVDQANAILMNYFENVSPPNLTAVDLTALGQFICCMTVEQIAQISAAEYRSVIAKMGQVTCLQQETLAALKNKSEEAIGSLSSWTTSILLQVGNVAAGMNSLELSSMSEDLLKLLPPGAVSLLPENVLKELSPKLLSLLNPESLASMTNEQRDALNPEQLAAVKRVLGELPPPPEVPRSGSPCLQPWPLLASLFFCLLMVL